jgi:magnesium transporter
MSGQMDRFLGPKQQSESYNINYPPSMPGSPSMGPTDVMDLNFGDVLLQDHDDLQTANDSTRRHSADETIGQQTSSTLQVNQPFERRKTIAAGGEEDVCFPQAGMSDLGEDDFGVRSESIGEPRARTRRHRRKWPDLAILEEWSRLEQGQQSEQRRTKKITEPQLINGRLRPVDKGWYRAEEDAPYRFTYFNDEFESTIHSQTISELVQSGGTFKELFIPDPPLLSDSESSEDEEEETHDGVALHEFASGLAGISRAPTRQASLATTVNLDSKPEKVSSPSPEKVSEPHQQSQAAGNGPAALAKALDGMKSPSKKSKPTRPPRYGERPPWWLDVYSPTEAEMKVLAKAFSIHPLTSEDILMQEAREKIELFRNYYFVNYRSFDQDPNSVDYLEPVNMYAIVFREGVLSFHFSQTPHPANVRRRIRQLRDYMVLSSDWISYAIIDDITDVFVPMIEKIEDEVDLIDDTILQMHSSTQSIAKDTAKGNNEKGSENGEGTVIESASDMLRRVGDCRKKVMMLYRLLGNKADVIKSFSKRCTEQWDVAPRYDIGMYLGDIQDHIVTMTSNLGHYEK